MKKARSLLLAQLEALKADKEMPAWRKTFAIRHATLALAALEEKRILRDVRAAVAAQHPEAIAVFDSEARAARRRALETEDGD